MMLPSTGLRIFRSYLVINRLSSTVSKKTSVKLKSVLERLWAPSQCLRHKRISLRQINEFKRQSRRSCKRLWMGRSRAGTKSDRT